MVYKTLDKMYIKIHTYFSNKNVCCGYSLEAPLGGASNEFPHHTFFYEKIRKKTVIFFCQKLSYLEIISWVIGLYFTEVC